MSATGAVEDTRLLLLRQGEASVVLRIESDPSAERPALAHAQGYAFSYAGADLPDVLRELVFALAASFGRSHALASWADVESSLGAELRRSGSTATLVLDQSEQVEPRAPRWPGSVRSGEPVAGSLWPFDAELAGLRLGMRRVLKREPLDAAEAESDRAWLEGQGLTIDGVPGVHSEPPVLFASKSAAHLQAAVTAERALRTHDDPAAVDAMGALLGYPACCRAAVAHLPLRDDESFFQALLPAPGAEPASPLSHWLGPLALISHAPCSLDCTPTLDLAEALLDELDARHAGFRTRWLELAQRIHIVTPEGAWALAVEDAEDHAWRVSRAHILLPRAQPLEPRTSLVGVGIHDRAGLAGLLGASVLAVADHRAGMR